MFVKSPTRFLKMWKFHCSFKKLIWKQNKAKDTNTYSHQEPLRFRASSEIWALCFAAHTPQGATLRRQSRDLVGALFWFWFLDLGGMVCFSCCLSLWVVFMAVFFIWNMVA